MSMTAPHGARGLSLAIDPAMETARIADTLRRQVRQDLRKRGIVLGLSGGIDSSVCAALATRAVGAANVFCVLMPERDSDPESLELGQLVADTYGLASAVEDIGPMLDAMGCYARRDAAIRQVVPEYGPGWSCKIAISDALAGGYAISWLVVQDPEGHIRKLRMPPAVYLAIVAATNMKQRTRKQIEYYHADRLGHAVLGTPNRLEYDQGFFVRNGDGAADVKPIAHLYKTQVYALAAHLGVPERIRRRPPTTDTWPMAQSQDEFYFALPYDRMDLCLYGLDQGVQRTAVAEAAGLTEEQVDLVWQDIVSKRKATRNLHREPLLVEPVLDP
ncbi:NAD+ synthase [Pseudochelatococcus lubricantis]|uniref:NH(3)-dependent NAD(+) synthetase n=1 Tax=Pseudochelatococcus lubricantis TaxID=1538102 RepID=A0ABX0V173_9HYPH|nr:NAD(+) synthase [Pseudochelatococcus lubricantis]NIJ58040.1 NAD+ synthase [Pseudochelatococcus lubricantis]